jgi:hypothetical protein
MPIPGLGHGSVVSLCGMIIGCPGKVDGSAVWTVSDGKISRAEFFTRRVDAFNAAGLSEQPSLRDGQ